MSLENILEIITWVCFISAFGFICYLRGKIKGRHEVYMLTRRLNEDNSDEKVFGE